MIDHIDIIGDRQSVWRRDKADTTRRANRDAELAAIEQFLSLRGATRCPTVFSAPTAANLSSAEEARRLERVHVNKTARGDIVPAMRQFQRSLRPWVSSSHAFRKPLTYMKQWRRRFSQ